MKYLVHMTLVLLLCVSLAALRSQASEAETLLQQAIDAYSHALDETDRDARLAGFHRAERLFGALIEQEGIRNADLYTNHGDAALQAEHLGAAILSYRRALRVAPGHAHARQNLQVARGLLPTWIPRPQESTLFGTFFFWYQVLSTGARHVLASVLCAIAGAFFAVAIRWRKPWARNVALLPALGWVALMGLSLWGMLGQHTAEAVIIVPEVIAHAADATGAPSRFVEPLVSGTEVQIVERRDAWVHVSLFDGRDGWVPASAIAAVDG